MDVAVIGGGPAALSAALYAARSSLSVTIFEEKFVGGQIASSHAVDNYLGFGDSPSGSELSSKMLDHVSKFDVNFKYSKVTELSLDGKLKKIKTAKGEFEAKSVIIATGASPRELGVDNERKFVGSGVSYCAACDGMFFKGRDAAVVGGGDTAVGDALYLSAICKKVYLIHRRDEFRASAASLEKLRRCENVEFITNATVSSLFGDSHITGIEVSLPDGKRRIDVSALFVAVGTIPNNTLFKNVLKLDENGFVITDEDMRTSVSGVFAAGDIRKKSLRQVITAVSDGAIAATSAAEYIKMQ
jgi:thioredoxin reductase (NADPH)